MKCRDKRTIQLMSIGASDHNAIPDQITAHFMVLKMSIKLLQCLLALDVKAEGGCMLRMGSSMAD